MQYYSIIKKDEVLTPATTWMNPEHIMRGERSQAQKEYMVYIILFNLHEITSTGTSMEMESRLVSAGGWEEEGMGSNCLVGTGFSIGVIKYFWN